MGKTDIGMVGLGVMGSNLVRNIASKGFEVSVYNRNYSVTEKFIKKFGTKDYLASKTYKGFVMSIKKPRTVFILVTAGKPVDYVIADLLKHLEKGDTIIDGGNSFYKDTQRRQKELAEKGIHFLGCGVSGGEEGALHGPSLMPGGTRGGYRGAKKILSAIAAKDFSGNPCVSYIGDNGAGHYVKMVHNGIEYGIMQVIAETYEILSKVYKLNPGKISKIFETYGKGRLNSFLFDITVPVLAKKDDKSHCDYLIHQILDKASQKGTGKWASLDALDRGVGIPTITQAVYARYISAEKKTRVALNKIYDVQYGKKPMSLRKFVPLLEKALYAGILSSFAQGYELIITAAEQEKWKIDLAEVSRIWQGGCIIRAKVLDEIEKEYQKKKYTNKHLFTLPFVRKTLEKDRIALRKLVGAVAKTGVPIPALSSSLYYIESMIEKRLSANVIQGLRDYFGAHTYKRVDMKGTFHTNWEE